MNNKNGRPQLQAEARQAIDSLPLPDRVRMLSGKGNWWIQAIDSLGVAQVADGPHGVRRQADEPDESGTRPTEAATCFPTAVTLASTWDIDLAEKVGAALGAEAASAGLSTLLGPGLNIKRHPGGGRNFEYFSEDPHISGHTAAAMVRGIQSVGVAACLKHLAANNHEGFRNVANSVVDERTLREIYLRGFEIAIRTSSPWTVMCAYNRVNEVYCSEDRWLLTDVLRDEWGFDGLVMADWGATNERALGVQAGLDLQMPGCDGAFDQSVLDAVAAGTLDEADIDLAVARVAQLLERTHAVTASGPKPIDYAQHHGLARKVAAAGTVLLSNDGALPLLPSAKIALLGAFAKKPRYQGAGSSQVKPTQMTNLYDELSPHHELDYRAVYNPITGEAPAKAILDAAQRARSADVAIVLVGLPDTYESEGFDRTDIFAPEDMNALVEQVCAAQPNTIVVLLNGAPIHMPWSNRPAAIVEAYHGGQAGGAAMADVLRGIAEPGGRLAESIPMDVHDLASDQNFPGLPRQTEYREGHLIGYRFHDSAEIPPRFAFGHGLSYTSFAVEVGDVGHEPTADNQTAMTLSVSVTNTGDRSGSEVVQVYCQPSLRDPHRPVRELVGYAKVHLDPGATEVVEIKIDDRAFDVYDVTKQGWITVAGAYGLVVGRSSRELIGQVSILVEGYRFAPTTGSPTDWLSDDAAFAAVVGRPLPSPPTSRPFDRNSTGVDIATHPVGRLLMTAVNKFGGRAVRSEMPEITDEMLEMYLRTASELPLRTAVAMGGGKVRLAYIDTLIAVLNGEWRTIGSKSFGQATQGLKRLLRRR